MSASQRFIPTSIPYLGPEETERVMEALQTGWISSLGPNLEAFEKEFAAFCGTTHAITVSNGTTALHLALEALGIGAGDEVIVPDLTFVATANAVVHAGARPVIVDIDSRNLCLDPEAFRKAITPKTKAVIPVHLYGHPAEMDRIEEIARAHGIFVIEDAAEAHGATWKGKTVGSFGDAGVFSFYGNKIITTGEGGMITTNNSALAEKMRFYRDHAMSKERRYYHPEVGWNYRMTNIQAAIGLAQMGRVREVLARRAEILQRYRDGLSSVEGLTFNRKLPDAQNVVWLACVELADPSQRPRILAGLKERGIDSRPYFLPLSAMPMYERTPGSVSLAVSERGFNLPTYYQLTNDEIDYVCETLVQLLA